MTTLIFPADNQAGRDYAVAAAERGEVVVFASSNHAAGCWMIPCIHDVDFMETFRSLCTTYDVERVFSPVASVYAFLHKTGISLVGKSPIQQEMDEHRALMTRAVELAPVAQLPVLEVASILKHAAAIYGESNDDKLAAMMGMFSTAPKGRVVEIGSLAGRTAFVLCYLARKYHIGYVITIDPWSAVEGVQHDSPQTLTDLTMEWDWDVLAEMFAVNLILFTHNHNHIREPSAKAFELHPKLNDISVLHIDGNHDYISVKQDCNLWCSRMVPGGWLILDDYIWAHGDGPKRAGDELLSANEGNVEQYFECGKALFVKFKGVPK